MSSLPKTMRALKATNPGHAAVQSVPLPNLRSSYILVKVHSVALNPTDWKHLTPSPRFKPNHTIGCDLSGTVAAVGQEVTKKWSVGDRVAAFAHGMNSAEAEDGAFAEYAVVKGDVAIRLPENIAFDGGSTLSLGLITVMQGLFQSLGLDMPGQSRSGGDSKWVMVYGGSTATGTLAVQLARLAGYKVVSTNSARNDELVLGLGADKCFDYRDPGCAAAIKEHTAGQLESVFDCISEGDSPKICSEAIGDKGGKISFLLPVKPEQLPRKDVKTQNTMAYTYIGEAFDMGPKHFAASREDFEFAEKFVPIAEKLLQDGKLKVHPPQVRDGGLDKITEGLDDLKNGKVSGTKIVYNV